MLYEKTPPTGIDIPIQNLQSDLHGALLELWGIETADYECYGRCYRNQKKDGFIPEVFKGGKDYKDLFVNDKIAALSFFGTSEQTKVTSYLGDTEVHLIFFVNLTKLSEVLWRADEEVHMNVFDLVKDNSDGFQLTGIITGIANVFKEYTGWRSNDSIKNRDMQPFHCFRFNFNLNYNNNCSFPIN